MTFILCSIPLSPCCAAVGASYRALTTLSGHLAHPSREAHDRVAAVESLLLVPPEPSRLRDGIGRRQIHAPLSRCGDVLIPEPGFGQPGG